MRLLLFALLAAPLFAQDPPADPAAPAVPPAAKELADKAIDSFKANDREAACGQANAAKEAGHPDADQLIKMVCKTVFVGRGEYKARKSTETYKNENDLKPAQSTIKARGPVPPQDAADPNAARLAAAPGGGPGARAASPGSAAGPGASYGPGGPASPASSAVPGAPGAPGAVEAPPSNAAFESYEQARAAEGFLASGKFNDAAAGAEAALSLDPSSVRAYAVLANARKALGDPAASKAAAEKGLALKPGNLMLLKLLADAQNKLGESADAERTADTIIALQPTDAMGYALKAYAKGVAGDRDGMMQLLRQAAAFDPSYERAVAEAEAAPPDSKRPFFLPGEVRVEARTEAARAKADARKQAADRLKAAVFIGLLLGPIWLVLWMRARARAAAEAQEEQAAADDAAPKA